MSDFLDPLAVQLEPEIMAGRRCLSAAQEELAGTPTDLIDDLATVGWYDTGLHPEVGFFALVRREGAMGDLVGEILAVTRQLPTLQRQVFVYVVASIAPSETLPQLVLARRAFLTISALINDEVDCKVQVSREG